MDNIARNDKLDLIYRELKQVAQSSARMTTQSLSVVVPTLGCVNSCKFCVSRMHDGKDYENQIERNLRFRHLYESDYISRLRFARDIGCNVVIITGDGEPFQNEDFLKDFAHWNSLMGDPFLWLEIQTSGYRLNDEKLRFLRNTVGVKTISLSLSNIFDSRENASINGIPEKWYFEIDELCREIKRYDFNLRLSLNMTDCYNEVEIGKLFERANSLEANQLTFRKLYKSGLGGEQDEWIDRHSVRQEYFDEIEDYILNRGRPLEILPFGAIRYSVEGISTVVDSDCMSGEIKPVMKYLILRPDCKLYTKWDDAGSLLF